VAEKEEIVVEEKEFPPSEQVKVVNNLPLEPFILPVEHKDGKGFLRIKYSLLLSNIDAVAEVEENLPLMRETIYLFTKGRKPDDFAAPGKKDETVAALKRLLNRYIQNGRVDNIMITEFTVF
jgi:flagellar basal body-associated protein FliL